MSTLVVLFGLIGFTGEQFVFFTYETVANTEPTLDACKEKTKRMTRTEMKVVADRLLASTDREVSDTVFVATCTEDVKYTVELLLSIATTAARGEVPI